MERNLVINSHNTSQALIFERFGFQIRCIFQKPEQENSFEAQAQGIQIHIYSYDKLITLDRPSTCHKERLGGRDVVNSVHYSKRGHQMRGLNHLIMGTSSKDTNIR